MQDDALNLERQERPLAIFAAISPSSVATQCLSFGLIFFATLLPSFPTAGTAGPQAV
jgi:hypothetical protein